MSYVEAISSLGTGYLNASATKAQAKADEKAAIAQAKLAKVLAKQDGYNSAASGRKLLLIGSLVAVAVVGGLALARRRR